MFIEYAGFVVCNLVSQDLAASNNTNGIGKEEGSIAYLAENRSIWGNGKCSLVKGR